jgi:hypothetical protein
MIVFQVVDVNGKPASLEYDDLNIFDSEQKAQEHIENLNYPHEYNIWGYKIKQLFLSGVIA